MDLPQQIAIAAKPYAFEFPSDQTALLVIDMQRDFLLPGGFGDFHGGSLNGVQSTIPHVQRLLRIFRSPGMHVFHTREGHSPDLSDCPSAKLIRDLPHRRANGQLAIGEKGPMGRALIRGERGHDILEEFKPLPGEMVIDKSGRGAFWNTRLMEKLTARGITHLVFAGVTTECCFDTTFREANDRGFECCAISEATGSYDEAFKTSTLDVYRLEGGFFGYVASINDLATAMEPLIPGTPTLKWDGNLSVRGLANAYRNGLSVVTVLEELYGRITRYLKIQESVFIILRPREDLIRAAEELESRYPDRQALPPLFGVPFSVKDCIDIAGLRTTTGCPPLAHTASESAPLYEKVVAEGALFIGKTNLEQLATGMTGCRSPYGTLTSVYHKELIAGGSSSGSAVSVAANLVTFSLGSDTAGSIRLPAAFHGIVGLKPTRGTLSARGVTPACPSLDCMSLLARTVEDARRVWWYCEDYDEEDVYAKFMPTRPKAIHAVGPQATRFRYGVPPDSALDKCCPIYRKKFAEALEVLKSIDGQSAPIDWEPFEKGGELLYERTFVSERIAALPDGWLEKNREHLHPVTRQVFEGVQARNSTAVEAYRDLFDKARYTRQIEKAFTAGPGGIDVLVVPSCPIQWTIEEVHADPIGTNSHLGAFAHFANVLDMTAIAVPAGTYSICDIGDRVSKETLAAAPDAQLPFSVTLLGLSGTDADILRIAKRFEKAMSG